MKYSNRTNRISLFYSKAYWVLLVALFVIGTITLLQVLGITNIGRVNAQQSASAQSLGINVPVTEIAPTVDKPRPGLTAAFSNVSQHGNILAVRAAVSLDIVGKCQLELSQGSSTANIRKSSSVVRLSNGSVCDGFTIPVAELPTGGEWKVTIKVITDQGASPVITQTVNIVK